MQQLALRHVHQRDNGTQLLRRCQFGAITAMLAQVCNAPLVGSVEEGIYRFLLIEEITILALNYTGTNIS